MRIFLIGFMGSGKTTIGKQLASKLGYSFLDMDDEIQKHYKIKISEFFEMYGEETFRKAERDQIIKTTNFENVIISTGGGAPCYFDNIEMMNHLGLTIYLKTDPKTLVNRLKTSQNNRPLIKNKNESDLLIYVIDKLAEREPFYTKAKHTIQAIDIKVQDIIAILPI